MTFNSNGHPFDLYKDECRVLMEHRYKKSCPKQRLELSLVPRQILLPRCLREVWEKVGSRRFSLGEVTAHGRDQFNA